MYIFFKFQYFEVAVFESRQLCFQMKLEQLSFKRSTLNRHSALSEMKFINNDQLEIQIKTLYSMNLHKFYAIVI